MAKPSISWLPRNGRSGNHTGCSGLFFFGAMKNDSPYRSKQNTYWSYCHTYAQKTLSEILLLIINYEKMRMRKKRPNRTNITMFCWYFGVHDGTCVVFAEIPTILLQSKWLPVPHPLMISFVVIRFKSLRPQLYFFQRLWISRIIV